MILGVLILIFSNVSDRNEKPTAMNYSEFVAAVNAGQIKQVTIDGERIHGQKSNGSEFESIRPAVQDPELMPNLIKNNVVVEGTAPATSRFIDATSDRKLPCTFNHFVIHVLYAQHGWRSRW